MAQQAGVQAATSSAERLRVDPSEGARAGRTVLCGIDGSEHSHRAFRFARHKIDGAPGDCIILFHAVKPLNIFNHSFILNMSEEERAAAVREAEAAAFANLQTLRECSSLSPNVRCELVVVVGDPREQISKYVTQHPDVDMVVLGARGAADARTNLRFRLGSVSSHLVQHCPVPTMVVPEPRDNRAMGA